MSLPGSELTTKNLEVQNSNLGPKKSDTQLNFNLRELAMAIAGAKPGHKSKSTPRRSQRIASKDDQDPSQTGTRLSNVSAASIVPSAGKRLIMAFDYGTTKFSAAILDCQVGEEISRSELKRRIMVVNGYPQDSLTEAGELSDVVPTKIWYVFLSSKLTSNFGVMETCTICLRRLASRRIFDHLLTFYSLGFEEHRTVVRTLRKWI